MSLRQRSRELVTVKDDPLLGDIYAIMTGKTSNEAALRECATHLAAATSAKML